MAVSVGLRTEETDGSNTIRQILPLPPDTIRCLLTLSSSILELQLNDKIITQITLHRIVLMQTGDLDK